MHAFRTKMPKSAKTDTLINDNNSHQTLLSAFFRHNILISTRGLIISIIYLLNFIFMQHPLLNPQ